MRRLTTAAGMTAILLFPTVAHAASGWVPFHGHYVRYHTTISKPSDAIAGDWMLYLQDRARAIKRAKKANVRWAAFLAAQAAPGPTQAPAGGYAALFVPHGDVEAIICSVFGPTCGAAVAVASCESGLDPTNINPSSHASGLFQFVPGWWDGPDNIEWNADDEWNPFDPLVNTQHAYSLSQGGTVWSAWSYPCGTG